MSGNGLITRPSAHDVPTTVSRLASVLSAKGITIFAVVDHADGAHLADLELRPTTLVIFGNPKAGTPLMQAAQTAGIDLPLKMLVWQDEKGATQLTYNDPAWIAARHGADAGATVEALSQTLSALTDQIAR